MEACVGYVEKCADRWKLESRFFPSKVGGYPAWLDLRDVPGSEDLKCQKCGNTYIFLCQVYAPIEERGNCFHRTVFLFLCLDPNCSENNTNINFKVLRCQLPRNNDFYPHDPPVYEENWCKEICAENYCRLCVVCGCSSRQRCAKCKNAFYCSKQHQIAAWKAGHKHVCEKGNDVGVAKCRLLLPEYELLTEVEDDYSDSSGGSGMEGDDEEEAVKKICGTLQGINPVDEDLLHMARCERPEDRMFERFRKRTNQHPRQVLRYDRGGKPLWIKDFASSLTVPPCPFCGAARQFEFQVLPHLLNYLGLDKPGRSVDWGTLAVFTCADSCDLGPPYKPEFLWKQDFS